MRIIPVIDLQGGLAVHGVRGEREQYRPVAGVLAPGGDPLALARGYAEKLGLTELYVADLNAIRRCGDNASIIGELAARSGLSLLVDAGTSGRTEAQAVLNLGARQVVVGLETLPGWDALDAIVGGFPAGRLAFSLDMQGGRVLASTGEIGALTPLQILERLNANGWQDVILLDLARVGTGAGVDLALLAEAHSRFPSLNLLAGGGVRHAGDLESLASAGASGALVATALHTGVLDRAALQLLASPATAIPARTRPSGREPPPRQR